MDCARDLRFGRRGTRRAAAPAIGITLAYAAQAGEAQHFRVGSISMSAGWLAALATGAILATGIAVSAVASAPAYLAHAGDSWRMDLSAYGVVHQP